MHDIRLESIRGVDLSGLKIPQVAVYSRPEDYPDKEVARIYDNAKPTNVVIVSDNLGKLIEDIMVNTSLLFFGRGKDDVPALVGVFL